MIHLGKNTKSTIIAKGISAGYSDGNYRGLVKISKGAEMQGIFLNVTLY